MSRFRFDLDEDLALLPLEARRALDLAALKLSLEGWRSLPRAERLAVAELGAAPVVDTAAVAARVASAQPPPSPLPRGDEPDATTPPASLLAALGPERPLPAATWAALSPLARWALVKVAGRGRAERLAAAWAELVGEGALSSHLAPGGGARMVDVAAKAESHRRAVAESRVALGAEAFERLTARTVGKGDVLGVARVAGIMAAKRTAELIPLCHPLPLTRLAVEFELLPAQHAVRVEVTAETLGRTGVEMEALTGASVAALTLYDMLKSIDRGIEIGPTRLLAKSGGRTGDFSAPAAGGGAASSPSGADHGGTSSSAAPGGEGRP